MIRWHKDDASDDVVEQKKKDECNYNPDDDKYTRGLKDHIKNKITKILADLLNIILARMFRKLVKKCGCDKNFDIGRITNFMKYWKYLNKDM